MGKIRKMPDLSKSAMLLIDVVNDMDFPGADALLKSAVPAARRIRKLRDALAKKGVPVIYVNDNFGQWQTNFDEQIRRCLSPSCPGREIVEILKPGSNDYFVLKPKHSAFYATSLPVLLEFLQVETLVLAGYAGDICVLYTANDAYMRGFSLIVPSDCIASEDPDSNEAAVRHMESRLKAVVGRSRLIFSTIFPG